MASSVLYDSVTLRHFAAIRRLDLLELCHRDHAGPRWVESVHHEIHEAALAGYGECRQVLEFEWLGKPLEPLPEDQRHIQLLRVALDDAGSARTDDDVKHLGEAESIHLAQKFAYHFVTDDNDAFRIAHARLDMGRVHDTVDLLTKLVSIGDLTPHEASSVAEQIRSCDRFLRRTRPDPLRAEHFAL